MTKGTAPSLNVSYNPATNRQTGECADANGNLCASGYSYDVEIRLSSTGSARYSYAPGNKQVWRGDWKSSSVPFSPNSTSALRYMMMNAGLSKYFDSDALGGPSFTLPATFQVFGWYRLLPGLEQ